MGSMLFLVLRLLMHMGAAALIFTAGYIVGVWSEDTIDDLLRQIGIEAVYENAEAEKTLEARRWM